MKKLFLSIYLFLPTVANASYFSQHTTAYGLDIGVLNTQFKQDYGANFFADYMFDYNFYISRQMPGKFGFEGGISTTSEVKDTVRLSTGDMFPGTFTSLGTSQWQDWQSSITVTSAYFAINWYGQLGAQSAYFLMGGLEVTRMKINIQLLDDFMPGIPDQIVRTFSKNKVIPVFKAGLQYTFRKGWGFRTYYTWRNYESFNPMKSMEYPHRAAELQLDNSNSYYLGMCWIF